MPDRRRPSLWPRLVGAAETAIDRAADTVEALADGLRSLGRGRAPAPPVDVRLTGVDPAIAAYVSARDPEWFSLQVPDDAASGAWSDPVAGVVRDAGAVVWDAGTHAAPDNEADGSASGSAERDQGKTSRQPSGGEDPARVFFPEQAQRADRVAAPPREGGSPRAGAAQERPGDSAKRQRAGASDRPTTADAASRVGFPAGVAPERDDAGASRAAAAHSGTEPEMSVAQRNAVGQRIVEPARPSPRSAGEQGETSDVRGAPTTALPAEPPPVWSPEPFRTPAQKPVAPASARRQSSSPPAASRPSAAPSGTRHDADTLPTRHPDGRAGSPAGTSAVPDAHGWSDTNPTVSTTQPPRGIRPLPLPMPSLSDRSSSGSDAASTSPWPDLPLVRADDPGDGGGALAWAAASRTDVLVDEQRSR